MQAFSFGNQIIAADDPRLASPQRRTQRTGEGDYLRLTAQPLIVIVN